MIVVTGTVLLKAEHSEDANNLCKQHVARSLLEPGCISHNFYANPDNPLSLFFFEEWENQDAIQAHFAVPESQAFVKQLSQMCAEPPELNMYSAQKLS